MDEEKVAVETVDHTPFEELGPLQQLLVFVPPKSLTSVRVHSLLYLKLNESPFQ